MLPEHNQGMLYAITAFLVWGILPVYWKAFALISPMEVVAHRILWSFAFNLLFLLWRLSGEDWRRIVSERKKLLGLLLSALLLASNWLSFVMAVQSDRVLEISFGYFLVPLLNVLFGFLLLRERFSRWQWLAIGLAFLAILNLMQQAQQLPWLGLIIALTFAGYGLIRKLVQVQGMLGLWLEMLTLLPLALGLLWYLNQQGTVSFGSSWEVDGLLATTGAITSLPLLLFAAGARRLPLATLGVLQFIAPTCFFLLGIFVYKEPFSEVEGLSFGLIWLAVAIYLSQLRQQAALLKESKA